MASGLVNPERIVRSVFANSWVGPSAMSVVEWADGYRMLPLKGSPRPGRWRTSLVPYMREPMMDFTDPKVSTIVLQTCTQISKTEFLINCMGYTVDVDPMPMMFAMPSAELAKRVNKKRITPCINETPALDRHFVDAQAMSISFDTCGLQFIGANSASGLSSEPIGRAFGDEIDKWPKEIRGRGGTEGSALDLLRQRLDAFDNPKLLLTSTPTDEMTGIHAEYLRSDQARYFVPCPFCKSFQWLHFYSDGGGGVRWEGGVGDDMNDHDHAALTERVKKTAWYSCEKCEARIESHHKTEMLAGGKWVRQGQSIDADGEIVGEPTVTGIKGYQLSKLYSPFRTFGDVASEFVKRRGQVDRAFVNGDLGEPWSEVGERADDDLIITSATSAIEGEKGYKLGEVPAGVTVITGSIDVQSDVCYWQIVGWGSGEAHWLLDYGVESCPEVMGRDLKAEGDAEVRRSLLDNNWALMDKIVDRRLTRQEDGQPVGVAAWSIDSGHRTGEVYRFAARHPGRVVAAKGSDQISNPWQLSASDPAKFKMESSVPLLLFNANHWRDEAWSKMHRVPPAWGAWRWPKDVGREYSRQMASEQRVKKKLSNGKFKYVWQMRPGRKDNHWWDCTVQDLAVADHLGLRDIRTSTASEGVQSQGFTTGSFGVGNLGA